MVTALYFMQRMRRLKVISIEINPILFFSLPASAGLEISQLGKILASSRDDYSVDEHYQSSASIFLSCQGVRDTKNLSEIIDILVGSTGLLRFL